MFCWASGNPQKTYVFILLNTFIDVSDNTKMMKRNATTAKNIFLLRTKRTG
jgi:hypothetical protein